MAAELQIRLAQYVGEGFYPQAKLPYRRWRTIVKTGSDFALVGIDSSAAKIKPAATNIANDFVTWFNARPAPIFTDV